jgi:hypothetical protein
MSGIMNMLVAAKTTIATAVDAFFNRTTLLLNTSSTNGAQNNTFLDSSSSPLTITRNGNVTQGTFTPFSQTGWSNYFNGSSDYLTAPDNAALDLSGDFTIEAWVFVPNVSGEKTIFHNHPSDNNGIAFVVNGASVRILAGSGGSWGVILDSSNSITANSWNHIAATRNGNTYTVWINGVSGGTTTNSLTPTYSGGAQIGRFTSGLALFFSGYMSNLRVIKGTAVYTSNFTPSTTPLTAITNTSLLTCQSNRFLDSSTSPLAITLNGTPSVQAFSPFLPTAAYDAAVVGGSGYFDGSGDYLSVSNATALQLSTGTPFTIEAWVYPTAIPSDNGIIGKRPSSSGTGVEWQFFFKSDKTLHLYNGTNDYGSGTTINGLNQWVHAAVTWDLTTLRFFLNGVLCSSTYTSIALGTAGSSVVTIGGTYPNGELWNGYLNSVRLVNGTAVYTSSFTPPTAPLTAITNTSLLTNFTNSGIFDSTAKSDLETVGNAQVSTTQAKWGTTSLSFGATSDLLQLQTSNKNTDFGTGDFTVEFWLYPTSWPSNGTIVYKTSVFSIQRYGANNNLGVTTSAGWLITDATLPSTGSWVHVAVTRSGNSVKIWINGTQSGSTGTSSASISFEQIGGQGSTISGYIDDFRATKGYARYTATFTPPTAAFPLQ